MLRPGLSRFLSLVGFTTLLIAGCSTNSPGTQNLAAKGMSGVIHGGQQPISGVAVQLYTVGTAGDGSAATPLLTSPVVTNAGGAFNITGLYTCPSPSALVYITGTGGNPAPGISNPQLALMAALGPCGSLNFSTFISMNEITTVAAVYALAPYTSSFSAIGSSPTDATGLASAFTYAGYLANTSTGTTPGLGIPAGYAVPVAQVDTVADLLAACINSPGGVSGDGSVCGTFFSLTTPSGAPAPPTDTLAALLNLVNNPTLNTTALFELIPAASPYQPTQPTVPPDLAIRLIATSAFVVGPSTVSFSSTVVGFTQPTQSVSVTNGTTAGVNITSASITGVNASDFALVPQPGSDCAITVPANTTCTYTVSFTPSAAGARAAYLVLANTSANSSIAIALSGTGTAGLASPVSLSPSSLAFTQLGIPQALTLTNSGSAPLNIDSIAISNPEFTQANNCGTSLPSGASCAINVTLPGASITSPATLTVIDDASTGTQTATLSYTGPLSLPSFPAAVNFGHWAVGTTGNASVNVVGPGASGSYSFTITGPNASNFSFAGSSSQLSTTCTYDYHFQQQCYLNLYYTPTIAGASIAYVNIAGIGRFTLTGTADPAGVDFDFYQYLAVPQSGTQYNVPPTGSLAFPGTPLSSTVTSPFVIQNTGTSTLTLNQPVISGPAAADFTVTGTAPGCPYFSCPVVSFTPRTTGTRSATLTYTDSTGTVTRSIALTGNGTTPAPVLTAATDLYFSDVPVGTVSAPQTITVNAYENHSIQASLAPIYTGGPQPFVFVGPTFCSSTPCTLSIAYAPTSVTSTQSANVLVVATDTVGLSSGNIQAYGQVGPLAFIDFTPQSLTFPSQAVNTTSAPRVVTITNSGTTVLALSFSISPYGNDYTLTNNCPASLAINASCTLNVTFTPAETGTLGTNIIINGSNVPRYVALTGVAF